MQAIALDSDERLKRKRADLTGVDASGIRKYVVGKCM